MRAIVSILTAATLFVEGTGGWCLHPPGHDEICGRAQAVAPECEGCCKFHERAADEGGQAPVGPCQGESECHGICIFVPAQKSHLDDPLSVTQYDAVVLATLVTDRPTVAPIGSPSGDPFDAESPVRLHLLHQLLLI